MDTKGIGTLNEHTLHAFLKERLEPDTLRREVKIGRYVADIAAPGKITEIQTRGFSGLKKKLEYFLRENEVTVVYPVARVKRLVWVDPKTGETTPPRRSPKAAGPWEIFYELPYIKNLLSSPGLTFRVVSLDLTEYRFLDGWSRDRKRGSTRKDRVPLAVLGETQAGYKAGYGGLLPPGLPNLFTVSDFMRCAGSSRTLAQRAAYVLCAAGAAGFEGKRGREYLYEIKAL